MRRNLFKKRRSVEQVEVSVELAPRFCDGGLIPVITTSYKDGEVLMLGYMNEEALELTIKTGEAHYWSRSRECLWHKGETSGLVQRVVEMRIDDDQDAVWLKVEVLGLDASCHVGYRSCFYRTVPVPNSAGASVDLEFNDQEKVFDPELLYRDTPNPTRL